MRGLAWVVASVLLAGAVAGADDDPPVEVSVSGPLQIAGTGQFDPGDAISGEAKDGWLVLHSTSGTTLKAKVIRFTPKGRPPFTLEALPDGGIRTKREDASGHVDGFDAGQLRLIRRAKGTERSTRVEVDSKEAFDFKPSAEERLRRVEEKLDRILEELESMEGQPQAAKPAAFGFAIGASY